MKTGMMTISAEFMLDRKYGIVAFELVNRKPTNQPTSKQRKKKPRNPESTLAKQKRGDE